MNRTQIYLTDAIQQALDARARETGRTRSQLIREALEQVYLSDSAARAEALIIALESAAGVWAQRDYDGEAFVESLRRGRLASLHEADRG